MKKIIILIFSLFFCNSYSLSGWTRVTDSIPDLVIMCIQFTSPLKGFACGSYHTECPGAFLRTTNGGVNWIVTHFPEYSADDLSFLDDNTGYISAWQGPGKSYVLKTTNGGVNWNKLDSNYASFFKIKFNDYHNGMVVSKYSTNHFTTDGGNSWITRNNALWHEPNSLICLNADTWLVSDYSSSINKTTNGGLNWEVLDFNSIGMNCVSMHFINSTTGFSVDYNAKVFKTTNAGNNWFKTYSITGIYSFNESQIVFPDFPIGYISYGSCVYKTTNGGYNWNRINVDTNFRSYSMCFVNVNTGFVGGRSGFIYRTTTGGTIGINQVSNEIPNGFSLSQNYPNPFNPVTNIRYQITRHGGSSTNVKLIIFDILGKEVATLVNEKQSAGVYEVKFDASGFASGIYFYKLIADDPEASSGHVYKETKKMLLIK